MYQALYRKYRPKKLDDMIGQHVAIRILKNSIKNCMLSHAYIFSGPRGSGKTSAAKIIANIVNCKSSNNDEICGECVFCTQKEEQKLDIIEIDAASNNGVDEIREINNKVKLSPALGKYKIYIIDEVHMLTIGAFNALLKTLEEPPAHVIFILATTDPQKIPVTILSRCQKIEFKRIDNESMKSGLLKITEQENIKIEDDVLTEICRLSDGGMRDAISLLDQLTLYATDSGNISINDLYEMVGILTNEDLESVISLLYESNLSELLLKIDEFENNGKNIVKINEQLITKLREQLLESGKKNISNQIEIINELSISLGEMRKFNNPKLLFDLAIIKLMNKLGNNLVDVNAKTTSKAIEPNNTRELEIKVDELSVDTLSEENKSLSNKGQDFISREIKNNEKNNDLYETFINTRVDNTLANFEKKLLLEIQANFKSIDEYLHDEQYKRITPILVDGKIKAVGNNYGIFVYDATSLMEKFNNELVEIESFFKHITSKELKLIAIDEKRWNKVKEEFNKKTKQYTYVEEQENTEFYISKIFNIEKPPIEQLFDGIIEYN